MTTTTTTTTTTPPAVARPAGLTGRRVLRGLAVGVVSLIAVAALAPVGQRLWHERQRSELGERLLRGLPGSGTATPLRGRLASHPDALPVAATRCVNCHAIGGTVFAPGTSAFGTPLGPATLDRSIARRGGPPSRYDAASLCRLLREGIDPAWVMVDQAMPRYDIDDAQCQALWARLARSMPS